MKLGEYRINKKTTICFVRSIFYYENNKRRGQSSNPSQKEVPTLKQRGSNETYVTFQHMRNSISGDCQRGFFQGQNFLNHKRVIENPSMY